MPGEIAEKFHYCRRSIFSWLCCSRNGLEHKGCQPTQMPSSWYFLTRSDPPGTFRSNIFLGRDLIRGVDTSRHRSYLHWLDGFQGYDSNQLIRTAVLLFWIVFSEGR